MIRALRHQNLQDDASKSTLWLEAALDELHRSDHATNENLNYLRINALAERIVQTRQIFPAWLLVHNSAASVNVTLHACFGNIMTGPQEWIIAQRMARRVTCCAPWICPSKQ